MPDSSGCNDLKVPYIIVLGFDNYKCKWVLKASRRVGRNSSGESKDILHQLHR